MKFSIETILEKINSEEEEKTEIDCRQKWRMKIVGDLVVADLDARKPADKNLNGFGFCKYKVVDVDHYEEDHTCSYEEAPFR